jgi:hypothetical protein
MRLETTSGFPSHMCFDRYVEVNFIRLCTLSRICLKDYVPGEILLEYTSEFIKELLRDDDPGELGLNVNHMLLIGIHVPVVVVRSIGCPPIVEIIVCALYVGQLNWISPVTWYEK